MSENGEHRPRYGAQSARDLKGAGKPRTIATMRRATTVTRYAAGLAAGVLLCALAVAGSVPAADEHAIRAAWSELDAAWAARDVERISRLFADDALFAFLPGDRRLDGHAAIRAHFAAQFPQQSPALRHTTGIQRVRALAENLALVDAGVRVVRLGDDGSEAAVLRTFAVFAVMSRRDAEWQILEIRAFRLPDALNQP